MVRIILVLLIVTSELVFATEYVKENVQISSIRPFSEAQVEFPGLANYIRIYMPDSSWGDSNCRNNAADLSKNDTHILSVLLTAWASGKQIDMYVDDSIPRVHSTVCRLVGVDAK